jgi:hypothetical protein
MPLTQALIPAAIAAIVSIPLLAGCSGPSAARSSEVPADRYAATFDAARDVLRERRYDLARVDSAAGVLTTHPSVSAGLFTPWSRDQQTLDDELDDTLNRQQRTVRIQFQPMKAGAPEGPDLVATPQATRMDIHVLIERRHRAGQQPQPASSTMNGRWIDPALERRGLNEYDVAMRRDHELERKLLDEIMNRVGILPAPAPAQPEAAPAGAPQAPTAPREALEAPATAGG